ncbi:prolyl oligopeptidase family serine peptidase [Lutimonas zeaxanthinifaciens]|uniref:prolyl oligopeptidase family serine peptidase n=1 Tax=Lutimonas zeaxanthinifaciens TaxID=3060215 RepID=UPI00265D2C16|nr:prolyl oligopeptidase family serine peptidase [Lutimonas sp. YSD2104]WKK65471.1 prolyl oligopeptidase family serine peptidase [Lutimonas sp. YSD2104]
MKHKLKFSLSLLLAILFSNIYAQKSIPDVKYPITKKGNTLDTYFGKEVQDPYRWLEDDMSAETESWVKSQNKVTQEFLAHIPYRNKIKERMTKLWNYEKYSSPTRHGEYEYFYKNDGLQNQYVLYRQKKGMDAEIFLDPNTFSEDGTTSLSNISFTKDGTKVAYSISEGGSDWRKVIVMDALSKEILEDTITDVKFSSLSWYKNEGFYYSSYDKPDGSELSAKTDQHKLYYHKLGTSQDQDKVIFGLDQKRRYVFGYITEDQQYLVINAAISTSGNELYIKDLKKPDSELICVVDNFDNDHNVIYSKGDQLYVATNLNAPNKKIISFDIDKYHPEHWLDVIPETENVLTISTGSGYFFAEYMIDAISKVYQFDPKGRKIREIVLPGVGSSSGFSGKIKDKTLYYSFTNYTTPSSIYEFDPSTGKSKLFKKPKVGFDSDAYDSKQIFYKSKDGTKVPMIITFKKGTELDGNNPTILYGYGGFNVSLTPSFSIVNATWLEMGGVYAVANLRGGGEYGKAWHDAGTQLNKQNVFDDFIAAAEYLIKEKYTSSEYLAIRGGSNGGLLVGAAMTQRPDLMQVALPAVGVLDMLRYHTFTAGAGWAYDYGTSDQSEEMFNYLYGYSPVHNVRKGVEYPATLVTTGDHDDRVVPAHSFKFASELQDKQAGVNPVLIRIETQAGHGAGTPVSKIIDQYADIFSFTLYNMGITELNAPIKSF